MLEMQPTTRSSACPTPPQEVPRAHGGGDEPGDRAARVRLLRRLLRLPLRDDARGRADAEDQILEGNGGQGLRRRPAHRPLEGSEIDYVDTLMGAGFTVNNPNAVAACGCGSSFRTADEAGAPKSCSH